MNDFLENFDIGEVLFKFNLLCFMFPNYKCDFCNFDDTVENTTLLLTSFDNNKFVEIDQKSIEYMGYQQEQLINMIIESYDSMNDQQLFKSIEFLHSYLIHETPDQFPLLTCTTAISALISAFLNYNNILAFICLYNITSLFSDAAQILFDSNIFDVFFPFICLYNKETSRLKSNLAIGAIINILSDIPDLTETVSQQLTPLYILGPYPYTQVPQQFINDSHIVLRLEKLFFFFLQLSNLPTFLINDIFTFYVFCLNQDNPDCKCAGLNGVQSFLKSKPLTNDHFRQISSIDFINMADFFNDFYIENHEKFSNCLDIIAQCFDIYSYLAKYSFRNLSYDCSQILKYCANLESEESHFDDKVGVACLKMIAVIFDNCEVDCYQCFLYNQNLNILDVLVEVLLNGSYHLTSYGAKSLLKIIESIRQIDMFLNEKMFETLLKVMLTDDVNIRLYVVKIFKILFERAKKNGEETITECLTMFDLYDGCEIFCDCKDTTEDEDLSTNCVLFLDQYFPLE